MGISHLSPRIPPEKHAKISGPTISRTRNSNHDLPEQTSHRSVAGADRGVVRVGVVDGGQVGNFKEKDPRDTRPATTSHNVLPSQGLRGLGKQTGQYDSPWSKGQTWLHPEQQMQSLRKSCRQGISRHYDVPSR